jgi:hypothetical protein
MREHLSQMLGHYLVFVGTKIDFRFKPEVKQRPLTIPVSQWMPEGHFTWTFLRKAEDARPKVARLSHGGFYCYGRMLTPAYFMSSININSGDINHKNIC